MKTMMKIFNLPLSMFASKVFQNRKGCIDIVVSNDGGGSSNPIPSVTDHYGYSIPFRNVYEFECNETFSCISHNDRINSFCNSDYTFAYNYYSNLKFRDIAQRNYIEPFGL